MSLTAICIQLRYEPGDYHIGQRVKGGSNGVTYYKKGYIRTTQGYGWEKCIRPSKLIISIQVDNRIYDVWIDRYFKDTIGKLTAKRIDAIKQAMPETIQVYECETRSGDIYFNIEESELDAWRIRAGY